jgi:hypothetical protein
LSNTLRWINLFLCIQNMFFQQSVHAQPNKWAPMAWLKDSVFSFQVDWDSFFKREYSIPNAYLIPFGIMFLGIHTHTQDPIKTCRSLFIPTWYINFKKIFNIHIHTQCTPWMNLQTHTQLVCWNKHTRPTLEHTQCAGPDSSTTLS